MLTFDLQLFAQSPNFNFTATGIGKETVFGSPTTPTAWISAQDITMTGTNLLLDRSSARNQIGQELAETGAFGGAGSFTVESDPDVIGIPLAWGMGTEAVALNATVGNATPATTYSTAVTGSVNNVIAAGTTTFGVTSATNIAAGQKAIFDPFGNIPEIVTIASVSGTNVTITSPLVYGHGNQGSNIYLSYLPAYDHTLTFGIPRPTFTVQFNRKTDVVAFSGNKVSQMDITINPRNLLAVRFGTVYATESSVAAGVPAFSLNKPYRIIDPLNTFSVNGNPSLCGVLSASISVQSGLSASEYTLGNGRTINNIPEAQAKVTGSLTLQFSNPQFQQLFWGAPLSTGPQSTVNPVNIALTVLSPSYVNGAVRYGLQIIIANVIFTSVPTPGRSGSTLQQTVNFTCYQSAPSANDDIKFIVTNSAPLAA